jgi:CubicO group peptidase (beta-lactamase class C family)
MRIIYSSQKKQREDFNHQYKGRKVTITVKKTELDFTELHERMQWYVDQKIIPFANTLVMQGDEVVDVQFYGDADMESSQTLNESSIFRVHSSTKIVCSIAAMMLWEEGKFSLDDPLEKYIDAFKDMKVLKKNAVDINDTEAAGDSIRIRQILSHTAGFSYGFIDPESTIDSSYLENGLNPLDPSSKLTLESLCATLGNLPLAYQPGSNWRYSLATDVTARLVEVLSGQRFDEFLKERIFTPLGMTDTDFFVPEEKRDRLTTMYLPSDPLDAMSQLAGAMDSAPTTANGERPDFLSGGGGLMSTLSDYLSFTRMIINDGMHNGVTLIKPATLALMRTNQCANGIGVNFPMWSMPDTTFGLGFALKNKPAKDEPDNAAGEFHWGGLAGTHFWWSPNANITGICMTQRFPAFWHPFSHDFKTLTYKIAGA